MLHTCDEDSGHSSCSASSFKVNPITKINNDAHFNNACRTQEASTNTDLRISIRPRSSTCLLKSPDERDPFPSCRLLRNQRNAILNLFDTPRMGGLSNARSTYDIASSTKIESCGQFPTVSLNTVRGADDKYYTTKQTNGNILRKGKPVQRVASRLYKAEGVCRGEKVCVGPEFIVRASQVAKQIDLTNSGVNHKRTIRVILLNGETVDVLCEPNTITTEQLFEALVNSEMYEHNFMLGIAVLISGDFIFLPDDFKIKKVAPENWMIKNTKKVKSEENVLFTVFLRIKFFLPTNISKNIKGGEWRYRVYLQLRRATVEGLLTSTIQNLIILAGYALHVEFGEFSLREHGSGDYFLLEHYFPEGSIINDMTDVKLRMKKAHESRRGLDKNKAILNYITLAQTFRDYGAHFYSAVWATRDGFCRDVWLSIGPRGITLYSRNSVVASNLNESDHVPSRIVLQSLPWHHIHTFYYNKKSLYIIPNIHSGLSKMGIKYKLKMIDYKSYFAFWLASLHHRLYLKLYAKDDFINYLSDELSCSLNDNSPTKLDCSNYQDSYNLAVRNPLRFRKQSKRRFKIDILDKKSQNKEKKPTTEELLRQILSPRQSDTVNTSIDRHNSSNDGLSSSESCSSPRRQGVKMGTRVFNGMKSKINDNHAKCSLYSDTHKIKSDFEVPLTQSDSDELCSNSETIQNCNINSMKLLPERQYSHNQSTTAYVIDSPKICNDAFAYSLISNESCLNTSLFEKLDNMGCVQGERMFVTSTIQRDKMNTLGLQVAEGSDGNVYIKSITAGGPADLSKKLLPGDQIISVNGQSLLNIKYDKALLMLQTASKNVELIVLQNATKNSLECVDSKMASKNKSILYHQSVASGIDDIEITDDELLNEEALKAIHALIKLTKDKVINRMTEKGNMHTQRKQVLQKCISENEINAESIVTNSYSKECPPQKQEVSKFNTWRGQTNYYPKRRPLSMSIPTDIHSPENDLCDKSSDDILINNASLKSIQTSLNTNEHSISRHIPLPRNFGLSRKWLGPVRYPVTPCKNSKIDNSLIPVQDEGVIRKHFIYGAGDSDEDQIFL